MEKTAAVLFYLLAVSSIIKIGKLKLFCQKLPQFTYSDYLRFFQIGRCTSCNNNQDHSQNVQFIDNIRQIDEIIKMQLQLSKKTIKTSYDKLMSERPPRDEFSTTINSTIIKNISFSEFKTDNDIISEIQQISCFPRNFLYVSRENDFFVSWFGYSLVSIVLFLV